MKTNLLILMSHHRERKGCNTVHVPKDAHVLRIAACLKQAVIHLIRNSGKYACAEMMLKGKMMQDLIYIPDPPLRARSLQGQGLAPGITGMCLLSAMLQTSANGMAVVPSQLTSS